VFGLEGDCFDTGGGGGGFFPFTYFEGIMTYFSSGIGCSN